MKHAAARGAERTRPRRTVGGEILGRWLIAIVLLPAGLLVLAFTGGRATGALLIWLIAVMVVIALIRGHSGRRR